MNDNVPINERLQTYWRAVAEAEEKLKQDIEQDCLIVVSTESRFIGRRGGVSVEVSRAGAARLLVAGSHRVATDEETEAHHEDQARRRKVIQEADAVQRLRDAFLGNRQS